MRLKQRKTNSCNKILLIKIIFDLLILGGKKLMIYKLKKSAVYFLIAILILIVISVTISAYNGYYDSVCFLGACGIWVIVWFIIWIAIAIWVYKDAERRGKSGALWLIIVILLGVIGIIIWLIVRPPIGEHPQQSVQKQMDKDIKYCSKCGTQVPIDASFCSKCGKEF